jgi:sec-independent protein translocase protein TatA
MPNIGPLELAIVFVIILVIFGPKRIPEVGRSFGRGIRELKQSLSMEKKKDDKGASEPASVSERATSPPPTRGDGEGSETPSA